MDLSTLFLSEEESECEEDDEEIEDCNYKNCETLVKELPNGMEIDLCPQGSFREKEINALAHEIEFLQEFGDESSDSDVSLDLDDLDDPRFVQRVMCRPEVSFRRKKTENLIMSENSKSLVTLLDPSIISDEDEDEVSEISECDEDEDEVSERSECEEDEVSEMSECEEDDLNDEEIEDCKDFKNCETLVKELPKGMEIDLCPHGSFREKEINALADDIQFLQEFGDESSDSDVSLDLNHLGNPRFVQKVLSRPEISFRKQKLENSIMPSITESLQFQFEDTNSIQFLKKWEL